MKYKFISLTLLLIFAISTPGAAEVTVESDQDGESYKITGELILDDTFSGNSETQKSAATCAGCRWLITHICFLEDEQGRVQDCGGKPITCERPDESLGRIMSVWRKMGENEPWLSLGVVCIGEKGPTTPETLVTGIKEQSVQFLPRLLPTTQPANHVLVNTDVYFQSNQVNNFGPITVVVTGIPVTLTASANWQWNFGDGESISTTNSGGNFPDGIIRHLYKTKGIKTINVTNTWNAKWSTKNKTAVPVIGNSITQSSSFSLQVHEAGGVLTR